LLGDWYPITARFLSADEIPVIEKAYSRKYSIQKIFFELLGRMRRQERLFIAVQLDPRKSNLTNFLSL